MNSVTYILYSEDVDYCILIDCGDSKHLYQVLEHIHKNVKAVYLTHTHYDHIYGLNMLFERYPDISIYTNIEGKEALYDTKKNFSKYHPEIEPFVYRGGQNVGILNDGEIIKLFNDEYIKVLFTLGHDVSCISYIIGNDIFTGDSYIPGLKTVSTFPRSDKDLAKATTVLLKNMEKQGFKIHCGHHSYILDSFWTA